MAQEIWKTRRARHSLPEEGAAEVLYMRYREDTSNRLNPPPNAISVAVASMLGRLAYEDVTVRPLSQYFILAGLLGSAGSVADRAFSLGQFTQGVRSKLPQSLVGGRVYSEWELAYMF
jgi:hypothetical protein